MQNKQVLCGFCIPCKHTQSIVYFIEEVIHGRAKLKKALSWLGREIVSTTKIYFYPLTPSFWKGGWRTYFSIDKKVENEEDPEGR